MSDWRLPMAVLIKADTMVRKFMSYSGVTDYLACVLALLLSGMQSVPGNAEAWMRLGSCRFQLEQFGAAIPPLQRATHLLTPDGAPPGGINLQDTLWLLVQVRRHLPVMLFRAFVSHVCIRVCNFALTWSFMI